MDLGRLLLAFCESFCQDTPLKHRFFAAMMTASSWQDPWETPLARSRETNMLFFLRAFVNALQDTLYGDEAWVKTVRKLSQPPSPLVPKRHSRRCCKRSPSSHIAS